MDVVWIYDVSVSQPFFLNRDVEHLTVPLFSAKQRFDSKMTFYTTQYDIDASVVKPLVFDTFGAWEPRTEENLRDLVRVIAGGDLLLRARLWRELRNRIAVALGSEHAQLVRRLAARMRLADEASGGGQAATTLLGTGLAEIGSGANSAE